MVISSFNKIISFVYLNRKYLFYNIIFDLHLTIFSLKLFCTTTNNIIILIISWKIHNTGFFYWVDNGYWPRSHGGRGP